MAVLQIEKPKNVRKCSSFASNPVYPEVHYSSRLTYAMNEKISHETDKVTELIALTKSCNVAWEKESALKLKLSP